VNESLRFFIIDDEPDVIRFLSALLEAEGHQVFSESDGKHALERLLATRPDCIVLDAMLADRDGFSLCRAIRTHEELRNARIIVTSAKPYEHARQHALEMGADAYIRKPLQAESFIADLVRVVEDRIDVTFWGVRGTLPVPGRTALRYGGNTSCVTMEFPRGQLFVFDAGTGIKALSDHLVRRGHQPLNAKIFISHPHWDHINALPFFRPLYQRGNEFEILGSAQGDTSLSELISAQMDGVYFPIRFKEFGAHVRFTELGEQDVRVDGIQVRTLFLSHPGTCLGFRVDYNGRSVCYVTDNELYPEGTRFHDRRYVERLTAFVSGTDMLITDTTYDDADYPERMHWGHSSVGQVAKVASAARVRTWCLFHHDPDQSDNDIDAKVSAARKALERLGSDVMAIAPAEGQSFKI
jgi:phosphoribosyl 1,2-cyclic phosphodiesterase/ActR/RegA family two-component response regulator